MSATEWYYADDDGEQSGPVSIQMLNGLFKAGGVNPETLVWNETMDDWKELKAIPNIFAPIDNKPPPPAPRPKPTSAAPPPPESAYTSSAPKSSSAPLGYSDDTDAYNDMGLLKTTNKNTTQNQYTPGWATDDRLMHSNIDDDFAKQLNITRNTQQRDQTNNLGLRTTGNGMANAYNGDYSAIGGRNHQSFDNTTEDSYNNPGASSQALHRQVIDEAGVVKNITRDRRNEAFGNMRTDKVDLIAPGVKLHSSKGMDNALDIVYFVQNENNDPVTVSLNFGGSEGIDLVDPILPSGGMKVEKKFQAHSKEQLAHVKQARGQAGSLRVAVGVVTPHSGRSLGDQPAPARGRAQSVEVGAPERKQLAPNLFLLKQKTSNPLGFIYSIENGRAKDYEFSMNFEGSKNVRLEGNGASTSIKVVIAPSDTVVVATAVQADVTTGISIKTSMGIKEMRTASQPLAKSSSDPLRGPAGSSMKRVTQDYKAKDQTEMDVSRGDEVFLQGGNAGGGDGYVVGVNARTGATGLVPASVLKDAVDGDTVVTSGGGYNNVMRPSASGGWSGGKGKEIATPVAKTGRPPAPPPKKVSGWDPNRQATGGGPAPVAMVGMGNEGAGSAGLNRVGDVTVAYSNAKKVSGIRVDPRSGRTVEVKPGETKTWTREGEVVAGWESRR
jgi:hypothetical protein